MPALAIAVAPVVAGSMLRSQVLCRDVTLVLGAARNAFPCCGMWWRGEGRREVAGAKASHPTQAFMPLSRHWEVGWRVLIYPSPASSNCTEA